MISQNYSCDLYLLNASYPLPGMGIFTVKSHNESDTIERCLTVSIPNVVMSDWALHNYVYGTLNDSRSLAIFGAAMMYNHMSAERRNVYHAWEADDVFCSAETTPYTNSTSIVFYAGQQIDAGEELFSHYGNYWFYTRNLDEYTEDIERYSTDYIEANGICISHIVMNTSTIEGAGQGIFAKKSFKTGEIIYVSPVLALPRHEVEKAEETIIQNYCMVPSLKDIGTYIDIALLPIGSTAAANHRDPDEANMSIRWHGGSENIDPKRLFQFHAVSLYFEYYATKDINEGDELYIDYGNEWKIAWNEYLDALSKDIDSSVDRSESPHEKLELNSSAPIFRHPIGLPKHLIPSTWLNVSCAGVECNDYMNESVLSIDDDCDIYMAPSSVKGLGRGIFSSKLFKSLNVLDVSPSVTIPEHIHKRWSTAGFSYLSPIVDRSIVTFGLSAIFNHNVYHNAFKKIDDDRPSDVSNHSPFTMASDVPHVAVRSILPGEEIFIDYGGDWFTTMGFLPDSELEMSTVQRHRVSASYLHEHGVCMTNTYVANSTVHMAGRGLFAKKSFKKGDIIYVSPVLFLPNHELQEEGENTVLINYCIGMNGVDIIILPLGLTAMANHQSSSRVNMIYKWKDSTVLDVEPSVLLESYQTMADLVYIADRDINKDEELFINYGDLWENEWLQYIRLVANVLSINETNVNETHLESSGVIFRRPLDAPEGIFPESWKSITCAGLECNEEMNEYLASDDECEYYMAESTIPGGGRGIFSTRPFPNHTLVVQGPSFTILHERIHKWKLNDYVFQSANPNYSAVIFGTGVMYNYQKEKFRNLYTLWGSQVLSEDITVPYITNDDLQYRALNSIRPGDELFVDYGDYWFEERNVNLYQPKSSDRSQFRHSVNYLRENGICLSHVYVDISTIKGVGKGLFAKKDFTAGDIIYVSPLIPLPKREVMIYANDSLLLNYCMVTTIASLDVIFLPVGLTSMVNHRSQANMKYRWHIPSALKIYPLALFENNVEKLSLEYYALRDIKKGEELFIDYGAQWENAWNRYVANKAVTSDVLFRQPYYFPSDMIPQSWASVVCFGTTCLETNAV